MIIKSNKSLLFNHLHIFNVVLDIEKYPEFLPWCDRATTDIITDNSLSATLYIKFLKISINYSSNVVFLKPSKDKIGYIQSISNNGPFKYLDNKWTFEYTDEEQTVVSCITKMDFKSYILQKTFGKIYKNKQEKIILAFEKRLNAIYQL